MGRKTTPAVEGINSINLPEGNIVPRQWFKRLRLESGRADTIAVLVLSEVFYWYRPTIKVDEETGEIVEITRKFHDLKWQCSYQSLADRFGFTKRQVRDALKRLSSRGLITIEHKPQMSKGGVYLSNVTYIEPVIEKVREICEIDWVDSEEGQPSDAVA